MSSLSSDSAHDDKNGANKQEKRTHAKRKVALMMLLVEQGFFDDVEKARRWVMAGNVLVNGQVLDKPAMLVSRDVQIDVRKRFRYASRAGYKLEAALSYFSIDVMECVALDCGASTGGFTDCLLQHGASLVYAVEVGYGQLVGSLRIDPRVRNLERTNLSDLTADSLLPQPNIITLDLSYLSLTQALPIATKLLATEGQILALVKPLFEVESSIARRTGHIDDPTLIVEALQNVLETATMCGFSIQGVVKLALGPRHGVHEFFALFARYPNATDWPYDEQVLRAIVDGQGVGRVAVVR